MTSRKYLPALAVLVMASSPLASLAQEAGGEEQESANLDESAPIEVEDTRPLERGRFNAQLFARNEGSNGGDTFEVEPQLQYGLARGTYVEASIPVAFGEERARSGDVRLALFHRLRRPTARGLGVALLGRLRFPTGRESEGVDPSIKLILDRRLGGAGPTLARLHFNFTLGLNARRLEEERGGFARAVLGISRNAGPRTTILADVVREQERGRDDRATLLEVGARRELRGGTLLGLGVGTGIGGDSPGLIVRASVERAF